MCENLLISLVEKGAIKKTTQISATVKSHEFGGSRVEVNKIFSLRAILKEGENILFVGTLVDSPVDTNYKIPLSKVNKIDGMDLKSIARVYNLKPDGTPRVDKIDPITGLPLKRGRKPNWVKQEMQRRKILSEIEDFDDEDEFDDDDDEFLEQEHMN